MISEKSAPSRTWKIWIAGDYIDAQRAIRQFSEEGACFAISRAEYIYTRGQESGLCVTRINYPRFPADGEKIREQMTRLAEILMVALFQDSCSIEGPTETIWLTRREA